MKCSRCNNSIKTPHECNICKQKLCSEDCLTSHSSLYHHSNISSPIVTRSLNNNNSLIINIRDSNNIKNKFSPFLVKGVYNNDEIKYDKLFSLENFTIINSKGNPKIIGNGSFGQVYLGKNKINKKSYAIKHMIKEDLMKYLNNLEQTYTEIDIQSRVKHPNIINLLYVKETDEAFDLVMEYAKYGTLFDFTIKYRGLNENLVFKFFIQIVNAIKFLHDNNIIHRDIKPENILLFDNYIVKLCDFGWSVKCETTLPGGSFSGTTEYMSPELINNEDYGKEVDIWMLGILLYEMIHGFSPFRPKKQKFEESELIENIKNNEISFYMNCSDEYKELVFALLEPDVKKRYTIDEIYKSKFVKKFEKEEFGKGINISDERYSLEENDNEVSNKSFNSSHKVNTSFENIQDNKLIKIKKKLLLNRYDNNEELNDSIRIFPKNDDMTEKSKDNLNEGRFFDVPNTKRKESDILTHTRAKLLEEKKNMIKNNHPEDIEDEKEDEINAPKNNYRNRIKKSIKNSKFNELNISIHNSKEIEIKDNSPKNSEKISNKKENKINLILPNPSINSNINKRRYFHNLEKEKRKLDKSEDNINVQNIRITNYIFNNKENQVKYPDDNEEKRKYPLENSMNTISQKLLTKKLSNNQKNQILFLSLVPGSVDYNLLLNPEASIEKQKNIPKEKNLRVSINKGYIFPPVNENQNIANNISQNMKEFPFDHFTSNSSLDIFIQKTIFNNKMIKTKKPYKPKKPEEKKDDINNINDKEPNDNMRRRNKNIGNNMPLDNIKKEKDDKENKDNEDINEIMPSDNYQKATKIENQLKQSNNSIVSTIKNYNLNNPEIKTISSVYTEKENINVNKLNQKKTTISSEIIENINSISKQKTKRNYSVRNTNNFRAQKKQKSLDINQDYIFKSAKGKGNLNPNKNLKDINNDEKGNRNTMNKKNLFMDKIVKIEKIEEEKPPLKNINNKNNSQFFEYSKLKKFSGNKLTRNEIGKMKKQNNINNNKRDKKTKSVNKNREFKFNKDKKELKSVKSSKDIIKNTKELGTIKSIRKVNNGNIIKINDIKEKKNIKIIDNNKVAKTNNRENKNKFINMKLKAKENLNQEKNDKNIKVKPEYNQNILNNKSNQKNTKVQQNKNNITNIKIKENQNDDSNKNNKNILKKDSTNSKNAKLQKSNIDNNENKNENNLISEDNMIFEKKEKLNTIKEIKIVQNMNDEKIFQDKNEYKEDESNKNENQINVIVEKEIIEDKYDNFKVKEIHRSKETLITNNQETIQNIKTENLIDKDTNNKNNNITNNLPGSMKKNQPTKSKIKSMKTDQSKKKRDSLNSNKSSSKVDLRQTFGNERLKLCLENITQNVNENSFKENRTSRLNLDMNNILEKPKQLNLKFSIIDKESNNKISPKVYPKKIGSDSNSSNSSIYEYDKPQNNEENSKKSSSSKKKINFSNSETKITEHSKNHLSNIKKIKAFSDINCENINNIYYKEKSSNIRKQFLINNLEDKKEFEFKVEETLKPKDINKNEKLNSKKKEFPKEKKPKKMYKNKTDGYLNKNLKNNKINDINQITNLKKENSEFNKKVNMDKITNLKQINNYNSKSENNKSPKKKYKKSLTEPPVKDENEHNEKGNESESYIIEGDSEYGDTEIF